MLKIRKVLAAWFQSPKTVALKDWYTDITPVRAQRALCVEGPCAWFNAPLSPAWNSSQFLKEGPFRVCDCTFFFSFSTGSYKLCGQSCCHTTVCTGKTSTNLRHSPLRDKRRAHLGRSRWPVLVEIYKEIVETLEKAMAPPLQYFCLENPMGRGAW